ncbi:MAG: LLM class flavin-dependent oxidoreductase [Caldilineaceae bacterium]|nr:LLM class flavin-dependent oxidoreductase [Caldilineaceae bacterium]
MNVGLFMMPMHPPEKDRTQCFEEDAELIVLADALGFTEAWVGQHYSVAWEPIPANDLFLANVLPRTKQIKLGTGVSIPQYHHPVNIAQRLALLDHLSRGRLMVGFGQSSIPTDLTLFDLPTDPRTLGLMTVEGMEMVLKLWQSDAPFDFQGDYWRIRIDEVNPVTSTGVLLRPYQQPHPPVAMSVIKGNSMAGRMAGQRGYLPLSGNTVAPYIVAQHWETYCAGAAEAGRPTPSRAMWRVARNVFIGETTEEALDFALNSAFARSFEYLINIIGQDRLDNWKLDPGMPGAQVTPEYAVRNLAIVGDVEECTRRLQELWDITGGFGTLLMMGHDWDDPVRWKRSVELLKNEVMPALPSV